MNKNSFLLRGYLLVTFFTAIFFALFSYLYHLQIIKHSGFYKTAKRQHYATVQTEMERGMILDCHGEPLAISVKVDSIFAVPQKIKSPASYAKKLRGIIKKHSSWIKKQLSKDCYFVWLARKVSPECSKAVRDLNLEEIGMLKEYRRFYPQGNLAAHLLGFVGVDNHGLEGLERYYENVLSSPLHKYLVKRDALGQKIILEEEEVSSTKPFSLVLTIDGIIQHIAEKELEKVFKDTGAKGAHLVIMRPRTGEILALANQPSFNPNDFTKYLPAYWRNRVVTDTYEPGSSFKVISAAAALEENIVTPQDKFFCENGAFKFHRRIIHDHEPRGWLSFQEIIQYSSNIGMTKVSLMLGNKKLCKYIHNFGFGDYTKVDMPGEVKGILRPVNQWTNTSLGAIPYGQEIAVTSIQLINAIATVANNGLMMQPYIVKEIRDKKGNLIEKFNPRIKKRIISPETAKTLAKILEEVVVSGTGKLARVPGYRLAAKTGTAQKFDVQLGKYSNDKSVVTAVGFAPVENPAIAILVMVDEPRNEAWGGTVAAPVLGRVVQKTLSYLQISPEKQNKEKIKTLVIKEKKETKTFRKGSLGTMPDLAGQTIRECLENLSLFNLSLSIQGSGFLYSQKPLPGKEVVPGSKCFLKFKPGYY